MVLAIYVGFVRLSDVRYVAQGPMLTGILKVSKLPGQSVFWRFLASLNLNVARQLLQRQRILRERVWTAANAGLKSITLDADTRVHTLYGRQMGARKGYQPEEQRQEKLSAHSHLYRGNPRIHLGSFVRFLRRNGTLLSRRTAADND